MLKGFYGFYIPQESVFDGLAQLTWLRFSYVIDRPLP